MLRRIFTFIDCFIFQPYIKLYTCVMHLHYIGLQSVHYIHIVLNSIVYTVYPYSDNLNSIVYTVYPYSDNFPVDSPDVQNPSLVSFGDE